MIGNDSAVVSVVTRTMGHSPFLSRVCNSLLAAQHGKMQWVLVDDAGDATAPIATVAQKARAAGITVTEVRSATRHRGKALAAGIAATTGEFVHILDDDDTVEETFYVEMKGNLSARPSIGALASRCWRVDEDATANDFKEIRRRKHYPEIRAISLAGMAVQQTTPTCSLLFRRHAMMATGSIRSDLEVCEDYEFLLRFLLLYDIGLLDRPLSSFHVRQLTAGITGNSAASTVHAESDAFFRNAMLRESLNDPSKPLGFLLAFGEMTRGASKFDRLAGWIRAQGFAGIRTLWTRGR